MVFHDDWLDQLTDCVLPITELSSDWMASTDWLGHVAETICEALRGEIGVAVVRAAPSNGEAPWSKSMHAVRVTDSHQSVEWRERYTMTTVSSGLKPEDYVDESAMKDISTRIGPGQQASTRQQEMVKQFVDRYNVREFNHACCAIRGDDGAVGPGAIVLDVWLLPGSDEAQLPPPRFFHNVAQVIRANLLRIESRVVATESSILGNLTEKQQRVAALLLEGLSEKQIADRLHRSPHTVHQHVKAIYATFGVRSRAEFMARCLPMMQKQHELETPSSSP